MTTIGKIPKKRERSEIIYDILRAIQEKDGLIRPTHILYKSNLSHKLMEEYIKELIDKDLIKEKRINKAKVFSLTQKGYSFISKYKVVLDFFDSFGLN